MGRGESLIVDVRMAVRGLRCNPGFTIVSVLILALGIGAATAIFSVVNAVLLEPLPYGRPDRAVMIWSRWKGWDKTWVSPAEVLDYRRAAAFQEVAAWGTGQVNLTGDRDPARVGAGQVTANLFTVLGVDPLIGRTFTAAEDVPGGPDLAILGYGLWQSRFGGDPGLVGRVIRIDGEPHTVVGVMPTGFRLPTDFREDVSEPTQLWTPLALSPAPGRGNHGLYAAARLRQGVTPAQATEELKSITAGLTNEGLYPAEMHFEAFAVPLTQEILGEARPAVLLVLGAVGLLLLIACANVANLLLARSERRRRDIAVRSALGAQPGRLLRQVFTESMLLASMGAGLGLWFAYAGTRTLSGWSLSDIPRVSAARLDWHVLLFSLGAAIFTGLLFGLAPAFHARRIDVGTALREGGYTAAGSARRQRFRHLLFVAEAALAVLLLTGAGLMVRSLRALQEVNLGFDTKNILTLRLSLPERDYPDPPKAVRFYESLLDRIRALPGVSRSGAMRLLPLGSTIGDWGLDIEGYVETPGDNAKGDWQVVTPGALEALGERLVRGRFFNDADSIDSTPVALVNETMARRYWSDANPIGKRIRMGAREKSPWITVVGIVGDVRHNGIEASAKEKFYIPHAQFHKSTGFAPRTMTIVVKTTADPLGLVSSVRREIAALDGNLPLSAVRTMDEVVAASISARRFTGTLLAFFAALAVTLAAMGIYGVLSYLVSLRTREIGIRLAVGASRSGIMGMLLGKAGLLSAAGAAIGSLAAAAASPALARLVYGIDALDPLTFSVVPAFVILVAVLAGAVPAYRATRVDPLITLRSE